MTKVYSPNKNFNGVVANVTFVEGVGETNSPYSLDYFKRKGYTIKNNEKKDEENKGQSNDLDNMDLKELKALAKEQGVKGYSNMGKQKLISKLEAR
ncbi:Rho termination factor N-terminal domain-containing protein [Evansella tamaricis]|uniref:Rho termination factor N-terminal domain-containing protein n=1 Tax=Evansella tamaricis TaxID=2069301 RepID=A0ABS6JL70_9BACI|nr:Rho termination factor N-terminal domain-containing protein [Evansella tamaricis]MBU9714424.1 Rho termination factor N-terminal domain-containing protein [Evansella tamaricis]